MKKTVYILLFTLSFGFFTSAQTSFAQQRAQDFSQILEVQTDSEESVPNFPVTCYKMPNTLDPVSESDVTALQFTTNDSGEITIRSDQEENVHYYCEAAQPATDDNCWYFPNQSTRFRLTQSESKNIYLIGLPTGPTCDGNSELLLPSGTPAPIENANINDSKEVTQSNLGTTQEEAEPHSVWEWLIITLQNLFK